MQDTRTVDRATLRRRVSCGEARWLYREIAPLIEQRGVYRATLPHIAHMATLSVSAPRLLQLLAALKAARLITYHMDASNQNEKSLLLNAVHIQLGAAQADTHERTP